MEKLPTFAYHYFLDEAGDATFYGKGRIPILGQDGVSNCFIMGLLKIHEPLNAIRKKIADLLSHLLKKRFTKYDRLVLNIAERTRCTAINNLQKGLNNALTHAKFHSPERAQKCTKKDTLRRLEADLHAPQAE